MLVALMGASSNISARLSFDEGTGLLLALLGRTAITWLLMAGISQWRSQSLKVPRRQIPWVVLLGLAVTMQGFGMYMALSRIPVALALLVVNCFPMLLVLLTWWLNGRRLTLQAAVIMLGMIAGLLIALEVPRWVTAQDQFGQDWAAGVAFALVSACSFAGALWITEHKVKGIPGAPRSVWVLLVTLTAIFLLSRSSVMPGGFALPETLTGAVSLIALVAFYCGAFSVLFLAAPRLDMARNASVMNTEPVLAMFLGWWILGQTLNGQQLFGGAMVMIGVVALTLSRGRHH